MLLAIDTCGAVGGVALGEFSGSVSAAARVGLGDPAERDLPPSQATEITILAERELAGKTFSERLLATIAEMLRDFDAEPAQLRGIAVVHGPGSFTGIRIGVSAAKGLAEGLDIPVVALSRLQLLARPATGGSAVSALDAGRGEFYVGLYRNGIPEAEVLLDRDSLGRAVGGSGLPLLVCEERLMAGLAEFAPRLVPAPSAAAALRLGAERFRAGIFDDAAALDANYLRRSETEMLARIAEHAALRSAVASSAE